MLDDRRRWPNRQAPPGVDDTQALLDQVRSLREAARAGGLQPLLRGKRIGLLCEDAQSAQARLFRRAAVELGADVAHIRLGMDALADARLLEPTARVLGRLYDALECQGIAPEMVETIRRQVDVPVYDGLASEAHAHARLAEQLAGDVPAEDARRYLLQAALLASLA